MFKFNRGGTDYEIKYTNQGDVDLLVCLYTEGGQSKWRSVLDTYELSHPNGIYYDDENTFLGVFLDNLNNSLDKAHSDGDTGSSDPQERLTSLILNNLSFDGKHVILS
jgi:hypothetical protein